MGAECTACGTAPSGTRSCTGNKSAAVAFSVGGHARSTGATAGGDGGNTDSASEVATPASATPLPLTANPNTSLVNDAICAATVTACSATASAVSLVRHSTVVNDVFAPVLVTATRTA